MFGLEAHGQQNFIMQYGIKIMIILENKEIKKLKDKVDEYSVIVLKAILDNVVTKKHVDKFYKLTKEYLFKSNLITFNEEIFNCRFSVLCLSEEFLRNRNWNLLLGDVE